MFSGILADHSAVPYSAMRSADPLRHGRWRPSSLIRREYYPPGGAARGEVCSPHSLIVPIDFRRLIRGRNTRNVCPLLSNPGSHPPPKPERVGGGKTRITIIPPFIHKSCCSAVVYQLADSLNHRNTACPPALSPRQHPSCQ